MNTAITQALFHSLWQGALVGFAVAVAVAGVKSARIRYAVALMGLAAMPILFAATALWFWPVSIGPATFVPADLTQQGTGQVLTVLDRTILVDELWFAPGAISPEVTMLWAWGVLLVSLYRFAGWTAVQRLPKRAACAPPPEWAARFSKLADALGVRTAVALWESPWVTTPVAFGWWKPVVLMPVGLMAGLPVEQVEAILAHELAHIARRDYLVNALQAAVESLFFYHPAVWWMSHVTRRERELCCDDRVLAVTGDAAAYARGLTALEQHRSQLALAGTALAATGGPLMFRIRRMLDRPNARVSTVLPAAVFLVAAVGAAYYAFRPDEPVPAPPPVAEVEAPSKAAEVASQPAAIPEAASKTPKQPIPVKRGERSSKQAPIPVTREEPAVPSSNAVVAPSASPAELERAKQRAYLREALESPYNRWINEEVVWVITDEERRAFGRLEDDRERNTFIELFWLRRDPTPDTEVNELREEHYRRIAWANERFKSQIPGWKTDRGMVYVKYGAPDDREHHEPGPGSDRPYPYETWRYRHIDGVGEDVVLEFLDKTNSNEFRLSLEPPGEQALLNNPGAGATLYQQMRLAGDLERKLENLSSPPKVNMFDLLERYGNLRRKPAQ